MAHIINEMRFLPPEIAGRRFGIHVAPQYELPVRAENAPDQGQGVVKFTVTNPYDEPVAFVLYRGVRGLAPPYYFGNAFYSVYLASINWGPPVASWYTASELRAPTPSSPDGQYSLGVIEAGGGRDIVAFIFVAPPKSPLSFYEGGIPDASQLVDMHAYIVDIKPSQFCVHYSKLAVLQYVTQTGYHVSGLPPNPFTATSVLMTPREPDYPTNEIIPGQYATVGECPPAQAASCHALLEDARAEMERGDARALIDLAEALKCYLAHRLRAARWRMPYLIEAARRRRKRCDMLGFLLSGRAHAYYGLMGIFAAALLLYALPPLRDHPIAYVAIMVLSAGAFVDMWAHCYRHRLRAS
jgi:hypothetical protein